jgi:3-oxoadipate enol-lactonase
MNRHNINGLNVIEHGESNYKTMIFIHAFPLNNRMWDFQADFFKKEYRIIQYDLRGSGESLSSDNICTIDSHVDDLLEIISVLGIKKPIVCGLSIGGYILLRALQLNQSIFKAAILCNTKAESDNDEVRLKRFTQIKQIKDGKRKEFINNFIDAAAGEFTKSNNDSVIKYLENIISGQSDKGICSVLMTLASRTDTQSILPKLLIPTLVIGSDEDKLISFTNTENMSKQIPECSKALIKNAGHFSNLEQPDKFNQIVSEFLNKIY